MTRRALVSLILAAGLCSYSSYGAVRAIDPVPGATLLLPYFEVDLDNAEAGVNTTFIIRNALADAAVAHVVIHTDYAVGTLFFDVYLTGYDMETFDLREIFLGNLVHLAHDSPVDTPRGPSTANALFESGFETGTLEEWDAFDSRATAQGLQAYHRGETNLRTGRCAGHDHGDNRIRGFVTIDSVDDVGAGFHEEPAYYTGAGGLSNANRLWGEFEIRNEANNAAFGNALISIEADPLAFLLGDYTFYGRHVDGTALDNREPLAQSWGTRYMNGGLFAGGGDILYWRDPKAGQGPLPCGLTPPWYPLPQMQVIAFDEEENPEDLSDAFSFPLACGRVSVGSAQLPTSFAFGWLYIDFGFDNLQTNVFPTRGQGVVLTNATSAGRISIGMQGVALDML